MISPFPMLKKMKKITGLTFRPARTIPSDYRECNEIGKAFPIEKDRYVDFKKEYR